MKVFVSAQVHFYLQRVSWTTFKPPTIAMIVFASAQVLVIAMIVSASAQVLVIAMIVMASVTSTSGFNDCSFETFQRQS